MHQSRSNINRVLSVSVVWICLCFVPVPELGAPRILWQTQQAIRVASIWIQTFWRRISEAAIPGKQSIMKAHPINSLFSILQVTRTDFTRYLQDPTLAWPFCTQPEKSGETLARWFAQIALWMHTHTNCASNWNKWRNTNTHLFFERFLSRSSRTTRWSMCHFQQLTPYPRKKCSRRVL